MLRPELLLAKKPFPSGAKITFSISDRYPGIFFGASDGLFRFKSIA